MKIRTITWSWPQEWSAVIVPKSSHSTMVNHALVVEVWWRERPSQATGRADMAVETRLRWAGTTGRNTPIHVKQWQRKIIKKKVIKDAKGSYIRWDMARYLNMFKSSNHILRFLFKWFHIHIFSITWKLFPLFIHLLSFCLLVEKKNILHVHKFNTALVFDCLRIPEMMLVKSHIDFRSLLKVKIIMMWDFIIIFT